VRQGQFDELSRTIANEASRRTIMQLLFGTAAGGVLALVGSRQAEARPTCRGCNARCGNHRQCCATCNHCARAPGSGGLLRPQRIEDVAFRFLGCDSARMRRYVYKVAATPMTSWASRWRRATSASSTATSRWSGSPACASALRWHWLKPERLPAKSMTNSLRRNRGQASQQEVQDGRRAV